MDDAVYTKYTDDAGTTFHRKDGRLHRTDGPAVEYADGWQAWYTNGEWIASRAPDGRFTWDSDIRDLTS